MNRKEILRNLKKYGFKLAAELVGEVESNRGTPKLEWDMIDVEYPSIYLIEWGDGESKTGKAEELKNRLKRYQYWVNDPRPKQDHEHNRLMDEIRDRDDVTIWYKPIYEMKWCDIIQEEEMWSPNLFTKEKFFRKIFKSKYK